MHEFIENELPFEDVPVLNDAELANMTSENELAYHDMVDFDLNEYLSLVPIIKNKVKNLESLRERDITEAHTRYELIHAVLARITSQGYRLCHEKLLPDSKKRADIVIEDMDGTIACIVECKRLNNKLGTTEVRQLQEYMRIAKCRSGILTNGEIYRVYYCGDCWVYNVKNFVQAKEFEKFLNTIAKGVTSNLKRL